MKTSADRMKQWFQLTSKGIHHLDMDFLILDDISLTSEQARAWSETATFLTKAQEKLGQSPWSDICDLEVAKIKSQEIFEAEIDHYRNHYGYKIEALDFGFAESGKKKNPCYPVSAGGVILYYVDIPLTTGPPSTF